ncbi:uncharacterized protein LOC117923330 [Vitis riparia]|uniref:uncharacterized protein LOC117923330 n=1 Tax=Vitis riparia TaxID=96939 RepID=UPI00155A2D10|nr:uncharacterized protein LOC117923330 [Vitis riparia]
MQAKGKKEIMGAAPNVGVGGIQASIGFPGNDALQPLTTLGSQYGGPRGLSSHGGFPQVGGGVAVLPHHQHPFSIGGPALTPIGSRAPPSLGSGGAYVGGTGGAYGVGSQYGGPRSGESSQHRKRLGCCDYWFSRQSSFACDLFVILLVFG